VGRILCWLGIHRLSHVEQDFVKSTGEYRGFEEFVYQKGVKRCTQRGCNFEKRVWRSDWTSPDMKLGFWKKMRKTKETCINGLPFRQLMG